MKVYYEQINRHPVLCHCIPKKMYVCLLMLFCFVLVVASHWPFKCLTMMPVFVRVNE